MFDRTVVRPMMSYGSDCWPTKRHIQQMRVAEMRILWWMCRHTINDRIRNGVICDRVGVALIEEKLVQY
jgi:hypothetical protein